MHPSLKKSWIQISKSWPKNLWRDILYQKSLWREISEEKLPKKLKRYPDILAKNFLNKKSTKKLGREMLYQKNFEEKSPPRNLGRSVLYQKFSEKKFPPQNFLYR